jgi:hypothetical protein
VLFVFVVWFGNALVDFGGGVKMDWFERAKKVCYCAANKSSLSVFRVKEMRRGWANVNDSLRIDRYFVKVPFNPFNSIVVVFH